MIIYCEKCKKKINTYNIVEKEIEGRLKGVPYKYYGKEAQCPTCGNEVLVPEISEYNREKLYDTYRNEHGIISLNEIIAISEKYNIPEQNISRYLGWSSSKFSHYLSGYIPVKSHSDVLRKILENPESLAEYIKKYIQEHPEDQAAKKDLDHLTAEFLSRNI